MRSPTRKVAERAAEWLEDPPEPQAEASFDERYATLLFRAFLAVLTVRLQRPTARITPRSRRWRARNGRVEHVTCEPYFCPSGEPPHHPLLVRVLVNKVAVGLVSEVDAVRQRSPVRATSSRRATSRAARRDGRSSSRSFPGELLRFASYIADLVAAAERDEDEGAVEPPTPAEVIVESEGVHGTRALYVWSERAWDYFADRVWMDEIVPRTRTSWLCENSEGAHDDERHHPDEHRTDGEEAGRTRQADPQRVAYHQLDTLLVMGEMRVDAERGPVTEYPSYRDLAKRFGISHSLVTAYSSRHNCLRRREAASEKIRKVTDEKARDGARRGERAHHRDHRPLPRGVRQGARRGPRARRQRR